MLNIAIACGVPFCLFIKQSDTRKVGHHNNLSSLMESTLEALYAAGYVDASGLLSFIAQLYNKDLLAQFVEGPSVQVTRYQRGRVLLRSDREHEGFCITDQVLEDKILMLIGHITSGDPSTESSLWAHPSLLEEESSQVHGAWTPGCYSLLKNLENSIVNKKQYVWRMRKQWAKYLQTGCKGSYAPDFVPTNKYFEEGTSMMCQAFLIDWQYKCLMELSVAEHFNPFAHRD
ncbi:hypothetical protein DFH09DRAFT_1081088 [Mycena vulgaris]|nr:hypothetical protein DFH09DRAFT_1081088 [Mycena vulgaris]